MARLNRFAAATALAAAFSLAATPVVARDYHHWHRWHRDRVDGGDVLAGALILGGLAAIASAANKQDRQDRQPATPPPVLVPSDRQDYHDQGSQQDEGLDRIADTCAAAVERRHGRVDAVDDVTRDSDGWSVSGVLEDGSGFDCRIGNDEQILSVNYGANRAEVENEDGDSDQPPPPSDAQPSDDDALPGVDNRPVWHGDQPQPQGEAEPQDDGRYSTSNAPDFGQSA